MSRPALTIPQPASDAADDLFRRADELDQLILRDLPSALRLTESLVEDARATGLAACQARAWSVRASALAYGNRFEESLEAFQQAAAHAREGGDHAAEARAWLGAMHPLARTGRFDDAVAQGERAHRALEVLGRPDLAMRAAVNLGVLQRMRGRPEEALPWFDRGRPAAIDQPVVLAQIDSNRAEALLDLNRFSEAEAAFRQALREFQAAGSSRAAAIVEGNLADLFGRQGRYHLSLRHYEAARAVLERDGATGEAGRLEAEQAETLVALGMMEPSVPVYRSAIAKLAAREMAHEQWRAAAGLSRTLVALGRPDEAEAALRDAGDPASAPETVGPLIAMAQAEIRLAREETDAAREILARVLASLPASTVLATEIRRSLILLDLREGRTSSASEQLEQALAQARWLESAPLEAELLHLRGLVHRRERRLDEAIADLEQAVALHERLRGALAGETLRTAFLGRRSGAYTDLVGTLLAAGLVTRAFEAAEQAKSRSLLDLVSGVVNSWLDGTNRHSDDLTTRMAESRATVRALLSRRDLLKGGAAESRWRESLRSAEQELHLIEARLAGSAESHGLLAVPASLATIQSSLKPGDVLIEYFLSEDRWIVFAVTVGACHVIELTVSIETVQEQIEELYFQMARPRPGGVMPSSAVDDGLDALAALHDSLIRPIEEHLSSAGRLIVVPHGPLHVVPFGALGDGASPLLARFDVRTAPSATIAADLGRSRRPARPGALVVGVADADAPWIEQEATRVARAAGSPMLLNDAATCERFRRDSASAGLIHVACHGRFDPAEPLTSGLRLADGWLTVRDLCECDLAGTTVVLSTCESGMVATPKAEELLGLTRGLLTAGARRVVSALWPVHDAETMELMAGAYDRCASGGVVRAEAFTQALRSLQIEAATARRHPTLWAPFVVTGGVEP